MKRSIIKHCLVITLPAVITAMAMRATEFPELRLSNGAIDAAIYLPDGKTGYYRGTRFDWAGVMPDLTYKGHRFHGQWFESYSATNHDAVMGPVEEFGPLGYEEAAVGGTFVKIGVGSLMKPAERQYGYSKRYTIADGGKWKVKSKPNQVAFSHSLSDKNYGYEYRKTISLVKGKPQMILMHVLKNKGRKSIETTVYDHNFFVIDNEPTGPGYTVTLPTSTLSTAGNKGLGEVVKLEDNKIVYLRTLVKREQGYFPDMGAGVEMPYELVVENVKTGAGVKITGDRPIAKMVYWSSSTTVCPEPYINVKIAPGKTFTWKITYEYFVTPVEN